MAVLGLLVSTRTPMVSLVPVFLMAAYHHRRLTRGVLAWLVITVAVPFVPFLLHDPPGFIRHVWQLRKHGEESVWLTPDIYRTYGSTALLLERGLHAYVELVQDGHVDRLRGSVARLDGAPEPGAMAGVRAPRLQPDDAVAGHLSLFRCMGADGLRVGGRKPSARDAATAADRGVRTRDHRHCRAGVFAAAARRPGSTYTIDVGTEAAAPLTGGGFGSDERATEGERSFVWVEGTTARVRLPRAGWRSATIRVEVRPHEPIAGLQQRVTATLNGAAIGIAALRPGWQEIAFPTRPRFWNFGFNLLDLHFSYAVPDPTSNREFSVAIDRVTID